MKFLLDVGITPQLGRMLEASGHSFRYVPQYYPNTSSDVEILEIARQEGEVIITHDTDFGALLAFSEASSPSVILFRIHHINAELFHNLITENWPEIEQPLLAGSVVVIEVNSIRIRKLPFN